MKLSCLELSLLHYQKKVLTLLATEVNFTYLKFSECALEKNDQLEKNS